LRVTKSHPGRLAGTAELPQQADWVAAARRTGGQCQFL